MIYKGNYSEWIDNRWIDYLLNNDGVPRPKTSSENPDTEEFRMATEAGYDLSQTYWYHYTNDNNSFPLPLTIPFDSDKNHLWWFIKMKPGMYMPMHKDPHSAEETNCKRYWMALQDYHPGHIHINGKHFLCDYKKGDVWEYGDAQEVHGACNIGYIPRLVFNFSTFD